MEKRQDRLASLIDGVYKRVDASSLVLEYSQGRTSLIHELRDRESELLEAELEDCKLYLATKRRWRAVALGLIREYGIETQHRRELDRFVASLGLSAKRFFALTIDDLFRLCLCLRRLLVKGEQYTSKNNNERQKELQCILRPDTRDALRR